MSKSETFRAGIASVTSNVERKAIDSDKEVTLMIERFKRFMKSQKKGLTSKVKEEKKMTLLKKDEASKDYSSRIDDPCLECGELGHFAYMCGNLKYKKGREAMITTWSVSEVEVVEECSISSVDCEINYFA